MITARVTDEQRTLIRRLHRDQVTIERAISLCQSNDLAVAERAERRIEELSDGASFESVDTELTAALGPATTGTVVKAARTSCAFASTMRFGFKPSEGAAHWRVGVLVHPELVLCPDGGVIHLPSGRSVRSVEFVYLSPTAALATARRRAWDRLATLLHETDKLRREGESLRPMVAPVRTALLQVKDGLP